MEQLCEQLWMQAAYVGLCHQLIYLRSKNISRGHGVEVKGWERMR